MDKIWAPWRVKYVTKIVKESKGCVFCKILKEKNDKKNFIFLKTKYSFAVLNIYPYNNGHSLVIPRRHIAQLSDLPKEEREDLWHLFDETKILLDKVLDPGGYNIGINLGKIAGAGFPKHLHIHAVPRWQGDVNFMPVISDTKVISESLQDLYEKLTYADKKRNRKARK